MADLEGIKARALLGCWEGAAVAEARDFARQLTPAQQQALLALPSAWGIAFDLEDPDCPPATVMAELDQLGLAYFSKGEGYLATSRGLEIRDRLAAGDLHG